jgi:hypothetical protein
MVLGNHASEAFSLLRPISGSDEGWRGVCGSEKCMLDLDEADFSRIILEGGVGRSERAEGPQARLRQSERERFGGTYLYRAFRRPS